MNNFGESAGGVLLQLIVFIVVLIYVAYVVWSFIRAALLHRLRKYLRTVSMHAGGRTLPPIVHALPKPEGIGGRHRPRRTRMS